MSCFFFTYDSFAQTLEGYVVAGESFDGIIIGKSTDQDVIAGYGIEYKLVKHKSYSYELVYDKLGLSFYYCQADPNKEVFSVNIQKPYKVTTGKGIILGQSTFAEVFGAYGSTDESSSGFEYKGISFFYEANDKKSLKDSRIKVKKEQKVSNKEINNKRKSDFVIKGDFDFSVLEVSNGKSTIELSKVNTLIIESAPDENQESQEKEEFEKLKSKVVLRIYLTEKTGTRQCHVSPQGKKK